MTREERNWGAEALEDARETMEEFIDTIAEQAREGEVSTDLYNDYPDGDDYHHSSHVDKDYSLQEAADLLDALSDDEETDSGLWEGLEPRRAVSCQAAFTYGNAVYSRWRTYTEELNEFLDSFQDCSEDNREGLARLWVLLVCTLDAQTGEGEADAFAQRALEALEMEGETVDTVDTSGALILADWLEQQGREGTAKDLRSAAALANAVQETEEGTEEESEV